MFENCSECQLYKKCRSPQMNLSGNINGTIIIVGEAPGRDEDGEGRPFVGRAGQLLKESLVYKQVNIEDIAFTNAVRCRPTQLVDKFGKKKVENRPPTLEEIKYCNPNMLNDIRSMPNLKLIVLAGAVPVQSLIGKKQITKVSGKLFEWSGVHVMPLLHPAYILRNQSELHVFQDHIGRIPSMLNGRQVDASDYGTYIILKEDIDWGKLYLLIKEGRPFAYDLETTGLNPYLPTSEIKCISFSLEERESFILPASLLDAEVIRDLKSIFEDKRIGKIGHNKKFDDLWMSVKLGINPRGTLDDTQFMSFLLSEKESTGLKDLAWKYTKIGGYEERLLNGHKPHEYDGPIENLYIYCGVDTDVTMRIREINLPKIKEDEGVYHAYRTLLPAADVLRKMEQRGILIDTDVVDRAKKKVDEVIEDTLRQIHNTDPVKNYVALRRVVNPSFEFNPQSHPQLRTVLYDFAGVESEKVTT
jgi:uracil-DNA glycosylase